MKKILILSFTALMMYSCGGNKQNAEQAEVKQDASVGFNDGHNAQNSLSYHGKYEGVIPCADCEGIKVTIMLPDDTTYTRTQVYMGHEDTPFTDEGKYTWNEAGNTITLLGDKDGKPQYFVAENHLIMLDQEGKRVEGELAEHYILKQIEGIDYDKYLEDMAKNKK